MALRRTLAPALALTALAVPPAGAAAAEVTETPVGSEAPDAKQVKESYVSIADPLPDSVGPHPEACDSIGYLRFRARRGPERSKRADAVVTLIPGFLGGASSFDQVARNVVRDAAARKRYVEVWAIDRRANCVEDHTGVDAAARERDPTLAYRYYWGGEEVDGKTFEGFKTATRRGVPRLVRARPDVARLAHGDHHRPPRPEAPRAQARSAAATRSAGRSPRRSRAGTSTATRRPTRTRATASAPASSASTRRCRSAAAPRARARRRRPVTRSAPLRRSSTPPRSARRRSRCRRSSASAPSTRRRRPG